MSRNFPRASLGRRSLRDLMSDMLASFSLVCGLDTPRRAPRRFRGKWRNSVIGTRQRRGAGGKSRPVAASSAGRGAITVRPVQSAAKLRDGSETPSQYCSAQHCRPRQYERNGMAMRLSTSGGHVSSGVLPEPPIGSGGCCCLFRSSNSLISCSTRESSSLHASARDWSSCCPASNSSISWSSSVRRWCNSWSTRSYWLMRGDFTRAHGSAAACAAIRPE